MIFTPYGEPETSSENLIETEFFETNSPVVSSFVKDAIADETDPQKLAIRLFYAVRDKIRYNVYDISVDPDHYRASYVINKKTGYCVQKACLLVTCARSVGIPAVIGTSDVVNHFRTPKMELLMEGREIFMHHAYAALFLNDKWVKIVPAFNKDLCDLMGVAPTEFDGQNHALLQEYDAAGNVSMVYKKDHGFWSDLPFDRIAADFRDYYPHPFIGLDEIAS